MDSIAPQRGRKVEPKRLRGKEKERGVEAEGMIAGGRSKDIKS